MSELRSDNHWTIEDFKQRVTRKQWQTILMEHDDTLFVNGHHRTLVAKHLGVGIYEISKAPMEQE